MAYLGRQGLEAAAIAVAHPSQPIGAQAFRLAMREFASGVAVVAAGRGEGRNGCTATSLCSFSVDPPTLIVCLARASATLKTVLAEGALGISLLASEHADLADRFAGRRGLRGAERFADYEWTSLTTGCPLLRDAVAVIDCEVEEVIERHTHAVVIGRVVAAHAPGGAALAHRRGSPLLLP
jgi:flavin reductase (DIM6/NTAB) family NADH-FMN oxidoreductase RutF